MVASANPFLVASAILTIGLLSIIHYLHLMSSRRSRCNCRTHSIHSIDATRLFILNVCVFCYQIASFHSLLLLYHHRTFIITCSKCSSCTIRVIDSVTLMLGAILCFLYIPYLPHNAVRRLFNQFR